jgi:hypothetical protein
MACAGKNFKTMRRKEVVVAYLKKLSQYLLVRTYVNSSNTVSIAVTHAKIRKEYTPNTKHS